MDITSISAIVAAAGVIVGVLLTYLEVRSLVQTRQMDLILNLHSAFTSNEALQARKILLDSQYGNYDDYREKYWLEIVKTSGIFETLGLLVYKKLADANMIINFFPVKTFWEKLKPYVEEVRKRDEPRLWEWFEYLYNETKSRENRHLQERKY